MTRSAEQDPRPPARTVPGAVAAAWLVLALAGCATGGGGAAGPPVLLPAYAHNDYKNAHPLSDAIALGYRGAEADFFLEDGELLVAHDRKDIRTDRTLAALYLDPLQAIVAREGRVCADGSPFILNIESKEAGAATYAALHALLAEYADMLTRVEDGREIAGPVQVILVGWYPPLAELAAQPRRYAAVQCYLKDLPADHATLPAHLLRLITVQYPRYFGWTGMGIVPNRFEQRLSALIAARDAVSGRVTRVIKAPRDERIYRALLDGGVDLIGTRSLDRTRRLLLELDGGR